MDNVGLIEVVLGDVVHPANYHVVPRKSVKEIKPMESALDLVESRSLDKSELRVDKLVCVTDGQKWYRGRIKDIIALFGGEIRLEVFLIDYGILLKEVNYPRDICKLSDLFKNTSQRSFEFKLNGLIPVTRSFKFRSHCSSSRHSLTVSRRWTEVTWTIAHLLRQHYRKALVKIHSRESDQVSGELIVELPYGSSLLTKEPYAQILKKGGYSDQCPFVNVNQALIESNLAKIEQEIDAGGEVLPKYTVGYHAPKSIITKEKSSDVSKFNEEEELCSNVRRLSIKNALEHL